MLNFNDVAASVRSNFEIILFKFFFRDAFHNDAVASSVAAAAATGHGHSEIFSLKNVGTHDCQGFRNFDERMAALRRSRVVSSHPAAMGSNLGAAKSADGVKKQCLLVSFLKRLPRLGANLGSFWSFVYFLSQKQSLRPLGYCPPPSSVC